jgi:hypothetical protein
MTARTDILGGGLFVEGAWKIAQLWEASSRCAKSHDRRNCG